MAKPQIYYTVQLERSLLLIWGNKIEHWLRHGLLKYKATQGTGPRNKDNQRPWQQLRNKLSTGLTKCIFSIINMNKYVDSNETHHRAFSEQIKRLQDVMQFEGAKQMVCDQRLLQKCDQRWDFRKPAE